MEELKPEGKGCIIYAAFGMFLVGIAGILMALLQGGTTTEYGEWMSRGDQLIGAVGAIVIGGILYVIFKIVDSWN